MFTTEIGKNTYILPNYIQDVIRMNVTNRTNIWVLSSQYMNFADFWKNFDFITYQAFSQWFKVVKHLLPDKFHVIEFNKNSKELTILPVPKDIEHIALEVVKELKDEDLYNEQWVKDMVLARSKILLGEIRGKIKSLPGYGGSVQLNGDELKNEGKEEMAKLEEDLEKYKYTYPAIGYFG